MTEFEKRVKLAEAMGLGFEEAAHGWRDSFRINEAEAYEKELPNPYTDANDCNSLIKHLNGLGWIVTVNFTIEHSVKIWRFRNPDTKEFIWAGDNWMHGVCELALKVISKGGSDE